ncbi:hypothetical protein, partial [Serratia marcescens]|uniref:hypothetical protein n=1 Tax=Serratia marcescens TaxID=615 RepID=UPI001CA3334E
LHVDDAMLKKNEDILIEADSPPEENVARHSNHSSDSSPPQHTKQFRYKKWHLATLFIAATIIVTGFATRIVWLHDDTKYSEGSLRQLTEIEHCKIYTFNAPTNDSILINDILDKVKNFSQTSKQALNCHKDRLIIYYTDAFLGPNLTGKKFHSSLTLCTESKNLNNLNSCVSHYYN